jgi:hypothetical protein
MLIVSFVAHDPFRTFDVTWLLPRRGNLSRISKRAWQSPHRILGSQSSIRPLDELRVPPIRAPVHLAHVMRIALRG